MDARRGFTLIELVIVIAIIGILASLAIPKFLDLSLQAKISATKAGLGVFRAAVATKYAASATGGAQAVYPTGFSATDFAGNSWPKSGLVPNPDNPPVWYVASENVLGMWGAPFLAFYYVTNPADPKYGHVGACGDSVNYPSVNPAAEGW